MDEYGKIIGRIDTMQTLIENFPMGIFSNVQFSDISVIDFIIEVLRHLGKDERVLVNDFIELFFNVPNAVELYGGLSGGFVYKKIKKPTDVQKNNAAVYGTVPPATPDSEDYIVVNGVYYYKTTKLNHDPQSNFLNFLEDKLKVVLMNILTSILSCSIIPYIQDYDLDTNANAMTFGPIEIPLNYIDSIGMLNICPTTEIGQNFYNVDADMTPNTLYKSKDLNAFLWYVLNRGSEMTQTEKNKMMWDSRIAENKDASYVRDTSEKWNAWYESKKTNMDDGEWRFAADGMEPSKLEDPLHPIMQFYVNGLSGERTVNLLFSRQSFDGKTIYKFNKDYLRNIRIFSPRVIIANMINSLLNGNVLGSLGISMNYSVEKNLIEAEIDKIITRAIEEDDITVSDCFFTFSNDDYNNMLEEMERQRYGGKELNSETAPSIKIEDGLGLDMLNQINSTATNHEKITTLTRTVFDISAIPGKDASIEISDKFMFNYNNEWLNDVIHALVKPLVMSLLSPKVMLLFMINLSVMGMINISDVKGFEDIVKIIYRKIMGAILSIIQYIKMKIILFLFDMFEKLITPLIEKYMVIVLNEKLISWKNLLMEGRICLPSFKPKTVISEIDDVNYADITRTGDIPESAQTC